MNEQEIENRSNFSTLLNRKKSRKANRIERTGTSPRRDVDAVSRKSHIKVNFARITKFFSVCDYDSKFEQSYESDDWKYKIIPRYEIEVEETIVNEKRAPFQENLTHMSLKPHEDKPIASEIRVSDYQ